MRRLLLLLVLCSCDTEIKTCMGLCAPRPVHSFEHSGWSGSSTCTCESQAHLDGGQ